MDQNDMHHWSGWPGAFCLKCGNEDPAELALADIAMTEAANICPVKGVLEWSTSLNQWDLRRPGESLSARNKI